MAKRSRTTLAELAASLAGARETPLPNRLEPALAEPVAAPPAGDKWLHEIKLDGYRMFCRKEGPRVRFLSRKHQDWTQKVAALAQQVAGLKAETAILDGEVVVTLPDGRTNFQALQGALGNPKSDKTVFYAFDLLYVDGFDLTSVKLDARKDLLERIIRESNLPRILFCDHIVGHGPDVFEQAARMGVEGIVSKRRDHPYRKGRTPSWKKAKCIQSDDFVVGGYTKPTKAEYGIGALLVGQYSATGRLEYAGRVGTGFSETTRRALADDLRTRQVNESPFVELPSGEGGKEVRFVEPSLVAHVEYLERTGEHNVLRHAVFRGLREDVATSDVTTTESEHPVQHKRPKPMPPLPASIKSLPDIRFTHPDKLLYPDEGITKLDLAKYYSQVAELMLPHVRDRPLSLVRCPEGIGGPQFFQKRPPAGIFPYVNQIEVPSSEGAKTGMAVSDVAGLLSLAQIYALEIHPWGARKDRLDRPDRVVFDLDPDDAVPWQRVKDAALELREILLGHGLESFLLATGGKGLHIVVPIARRATWDQSKAFSLQVAKQMVAHSPREFTTNVSLAARRGKIYIDYLRNRRGATSIAPYSTRARPGAPVAVPLAWEELAMLRSAAAYTVPNLQHRLSTLKSCPWASMESVRQALKQ